jgi:hypothetical protein
MRRRYWSFSSASLAPRLVNKTFTAPIDGCDPPGMSRAWGAEGKAVVRWLSREL